MSILTDAEAIIYGDREQTYGNPGANLERIANLWNAFIANKPEPGLTPDDVAMMMVLLKIAREQHQHKPDNLIDGCGYLALIERIHEKN